MKDVGACKCGGSITKVFKSGKSGKYCQQCMDKQAGRLKGAWLQGEIACAHCRVSFVPKSAHQRFCSRRCLYRDRDLRNSATGLDRATYLASVASQTQEKRSFTCVQCGAAACRRLGGTNAAAGYTNKYCSLACRDAAYVAAALEARLRKGRYSKCFGLYCHVCSIPFVSRHEKRTCSRACSARADAQRAHAREAHVVRCEDCGVEFCPTYGHSSAALCAPCAVGRARAHRLTAKVLRRTRLKLATIERVDPLVVFDRDGWTCQLCGVATPKEKRGTYDDDAPELDHIVALAAGGEHSYRNTQCACRKCNGLKSDSSAESYAASLIASPMGMNEACRNALRRFAERSAAASSSMPPATASDTPARSQDGCAATVTRPALSEAMDTHGSRREIAS